MPKSATLTLVPVHGKYCQFMDAKNGRKSEIWRVHPTTPDKIGTVVPYDEGVNLLCKQPQIVNLVSGTLSATDLAKVRAAQISGQSSLPSAMNPANAQNPLANATNEQLMAIIQQQAEQMNKFLETATKLTEAAVQKSESSKEEIPETSSKSRR